MIHVQIVLRIKNCEISNFEICSRGPENLSSFEVSLLSRAGFSIFSNLATQSQIKMLIEKMGKKNFYVPVRKFTTRWEYGKKFPWPRFFEPQNFFSQFCSCLLTPSARLTSAATSFDRKRLFTPWLWWILTIFLEIVKSGSLYGHVFSSNL